MKQECGPYFIEFLLWWIPRYKACGFHDKGYDFAKIINEKTRKKIDNIFYLQMIIEKPNNRITAYIYYKIVRYTGWIIFYFFRKKICNMNYCSYIVFMLIFNHNKATRLSSRM